MDEELFARKYIYALNFCDMKRVRKKKKYN
jgi:hypothetical protein